ncbi:DAPG hydrolase family protein [Streptomyces olivaceus]|uniref:DAPG hydrolase family protein n=1 Tax=Streptomyces olivaceus TaxID=47716 RepID=UPI0035DD7FE6
MQLHDAHAQWRTGRTVRSDAYTRDQFISLAENASALSEYPVAMGWLIHQIRPTEHGCEMRSRFFLNGSRILDLPAHSVPGRGVPLLTGRAARTVGDTMVLHLISKVMGPNVGHDTAYHCASEMNHLASFLPDLHEEFSDTP